MKVKELIEQLQQCDPEHLVIMSKDAEGNSFSPLDEIDGENNVYMSESGWGGSIGLKILTEELAGKGYTTADVGNAGAVDCIVLWPVN